MDFRGLEYGTRVCDRHVRGKTTLGGEAGRVMIKVRPHIVNGRMEPIGSALKLPFIKSENFVMPLAGIRGLYALEHNPKLW